MDIILTANIARFKTMATFKIYGNDTAMIQNQLKFFIQLDTQRLTELGFKLPDILPDMPRTSPDPRFVCTCRTCGHNRVALLDQFHLPASVVRAIECERGCRYITSHNHS